MSDHFNGKRFFNPGVTSQKFRNVIKWLLTRNPPPHPKKQKTIHTAHPAQRVKGSDIHVTFVNHSTVLIQWEGWNILTDPIWSEKCGPFGIVGPRRMHPPGIKFNDLPPIDLILLSHNHYDHMDLPTLKLLAKRFKPIILTGLRNKALLKRSGIGQVHEMDWWEEYDCSDELTVTFVPAQHFSGRRIYDNGRTLWGGFLLRGTSGMIYFAGDTGYGKHFKQIRQRYGNPRLSLIPIGGYRPRWMMHKVHLEPKEAVQAHSDLESKATLAIHHGTFQMTDEPIDEPLKMLHQELSERELSRNAFFSLKPGESRIVL